MTYTTRFAASLTDTCDITRSTVSVSADGDMEIGAPAAAASDVACILAPISASDDLMAVGPLPRHVLRLFVPAGTDLQENDKVTVGANTYSVVAPPEIFDSRGGVPHHLEAIVEKQAVS